jgi:hypothetical protein
MVGLDPVVGVLLSAVPRRWQRILQHRRVHRRLVGGDLDGRDLGRAHRPLEESVGFLRVAPRRGETNTSATCPN